LYYNQLFSVNYQHEYYKSKKFAGFGIEVAPQTDRLLKSYGLLVRELDAGFTILFKEEREGSSLLRKLKEQLKFTFFLTTKDRAFLNYSDILGGFSNQGYWLSNVNENADDITLLHKGAYLSESDSVEFITSLGQIESRLVEEESLVVEDAFGEKLFEGSIDEFKQQQELLEAGYLKVKAGDQELNFYTRAPRSKQALGVIDIIVEPAGAGKNSFEEVVGAEYKLAIDTKATTWRYNLINRDDYQYSDFKVFAGKDAVPISDAEEKTMINGEKAYFIQTSSPIRLQERYDTGLELEMVKNETDRKIKKRINLPVPDINKVKVAMVKNQHQAYSEMYIYF